MGFKLGTSHIDRGLHILGKLRLGIFKRVLVLTSQGEVKEVDGLNVKLSREEGVDVGL